LNEVFYLQGEQQPVLNHIHLLLKFLFNIKKKVSLTFIEYAGKATKADCKKITYAISLSIHCSWEQF